MNEKLKYYPGRKGANGAWQKIISQVPKCSMFLEAMCGSAVISYSFKNLPVDIVINDCDRYVFSCHEASNPNRFVVENLRYQDLIVKYDCERSARRVFYFDPPYLFDTRSYKGKLYRHEWKEADHLEFLSLATTVKSDCMISHYPHPMYDEFLKGWRVVPYQSMTRAGLRTEHLYLNYPLPPLLQDASNVGENYIDRQRIKRKIDRLIRRLNHETDLERSAILTGLIDSFNYITRPHR